MDKNKKTLIIGGSVGATALIVLVVASIALANRPSALIVRAMANTISDAKRIELFDVAEDVANGGSIAVSADLDKVAKDDLAVQAKVYTDAKNVKGAYEMTVTEDNEKILQASVIFDQDKIAMKCPELVDGTYGINLKKLSKNLPGSIFDPDEETDYSLDDEQYEYFLNLHESVKKDKNLEHDVSNMAAKYRQLFIEKLIKYSTVSKSNKTITVGSDKIPCTVVSVKVDEDALTLIAEDLIEYANNDKDLENLLYRVAANGGFYEEPDEYVDMFFDYLDDFEDQIEDAEEDIDIQLDFYITRSGRRLAQVDAELEYGKDDIEATLLLGKDVSKSDEISLKAKDKQSEESFSIIYTVKENSAKAYEAELEIEETTKSYAYYDDVYDRDTNLDTDKTTIKVEWDRRKGDFEFRLKDEWDDYVVKGSLLQKGDKYVFVLTNLRANGEAVPNVKSMGVTVTIDRHDPVPNVPGNYTEITTMDKREFKHFTEDIADGLEEMWDEYFDF